jgi:signal transduction histidine kinase
MISRFQFGGAGNDRGLWMVLGVLLPAVLLPTACLLYFINEAVTTQRDLSRQKLGDAYRGQLRLVAERIDSFWEARARELDTRASAESPAIFFEHCVRDGLADSVICLNADGSPAYPSLAAPPASDPAARQPKWVEASLLENGGKLAEAARKYAAIADSEKDPSIGARAAQASIRCLLSSGQKSAAVRAIEEYFAPLRLAYAYGLDGRLIAADEHRLYLDLVPEADPRYRERVQILFGLLQNYARQVPSAQRLFLMDHLRALPVQPRFRTFPTYRAERAAERVLSEGRAVPGESALERTGVADVWKLTSPGKRVIALYGTDTLIASMQGLLEQPRSPRDPVFAVTVPGRALPPHTERMAGGARLPGWQISMKTAEGVTWGGPANRQIASYLWIGILTIATVAVLAVLGARILRRQMRIAHLKTDLVAAVSHELKTPLASMKLLVESLLNGEQFEPVRTRQYLQLVARENSRLSRLIDNFLTFSRMERNRGRFEMARVRPEAVVRAAVESIGERFAVEVQIDGDLPPLYADEDALVTVLLNLLDNAYKYTSGERRIELRGYFSAGRVCFAVKDNGVGIAERDRKKIFRRFYQVDRSLSRQAGGVGLGLSIVEFIVKAHHGEVTVVSRQGAGSTFTIALPPSSSAAEAAA